MKITTKTEAINNGLKKYFTGIPCKNGHISERSTKRGSCVKCRAESTMRNKEKFYKYYDDNRKKINEQKTKNYNQNRIEILSKQKIYASENREKLNARKKRYYENNKDILNLKKRENYKIKKAEYCESMKRYRQSEKGKIIKKGSEGKRRALKKSSADKTINYKSLKILREKQNDKCFHCKKVLDFKAVGKVHLDHYIPLSRGGTHTIGNVVWSCDTCNLKKSATIPDSLLLI